MSRWLWATWFFVLFLMFAMVTLPGPAGKLLAMLGLAAVYLAVLIYGSLVPGWNLYLRNLNQVAGAGQRVALTFDDGPHPKTTPLLLDALKAEGVAATFFCIGQAVAMRPDLVRRAEAEGHLLANHGFSHSPYWGFLKAAGLRHEIEQTNQLFQETLGRVPRFFRPPFSVTRPGLGRALARLGMLSVGWSARGLEGRMPDAEAVVRRVMRRVKPGAIILLHECYFRQREFSGEQVAATATLLIRSLRAAGYTCERLDRLTGQQGYL